jgi:hypothetical protein
MPLGYQFRGGEEVERHEGSGEQWREHLDAKLGADRVRETAKRQAPTAEAPAVEKERIWRAARWKECDAEKAKREVRQRVEGAVAENPRQRYEMSVSARAHLGRLVAGRNQRRAACRRCGEERQPYMAGDRVGELTQHIARRTGGQAERIRLSIGGGLLMREGRVDKARERYVGKAIDVTEWREEIPARANMYAIHWTDRGSSKVANITWAANDGVELDWKIRNATKYANPQIRN